jgi:hypothetical protein
MALPQPKQPAGGAFGAFVKENRPEFQKACLGKGASAVMPMASAAFKQLGEAEKARYQQISDEAMEQYQKEMAAFLESGGIKAKSARQIRIERKNECAEKRRKPEDQSVASGNRKVFKEFEDDQQEPVQEEYEDEDGELSSAAQRFTPSEIDRTRCVARIWNKGKGGQCRAHVFEGEFCKNHGASKLPQGRVDGCIPEAKMREFIAYEKKQGVLLAATPDQSSTAGIHRKRRKIDAGEPAKDVGPAQHVAATPTSPRTKVQSSVQMCMEALQRRYFGKVCVGGG